LNVVRVNKEINLNKIKRRLNEGQLIDLRLLHIFNTKGEFNEMRSEGGDILWS
jgi:hypothetical protein